MVTRWMIAIQKAASTCGLGAPSHWFSTSLSDARLEKERLPQSTLQPFFIEHLVTLSGGASGPSYVSEIIHSYQDTDTRDLQAIAPS